jgi:hypothetical protein
MALLPLDRKINIVAEKIGELCVIGMKADNSLVDSLVSFLQILAAFAPVDLLQQNVCFQIFHKQSYSSRAAMTSYVSTISHILRNKQTSSLKCWWCEQNLTDLVECT